MAAKFKPKRTSANLLPNCVILNNIIGIFVVDHAPRKMKILARETPFLRKTIAAGKEAYNGPEENEPRTKAKIPPFIPASLPMDFMMVSFGTQTSIRPKSRKIGGIIDSIFKRFFRERETASRPDSGSTSSSRTFSRSKTERTDTFYNFLEVTHDIITPTTQDVIIARSSDKIFLFSAIRFPKHFISRGNVAMPTIMSVEIKMAICAYPVPADRSGAAKGNATKPGIKVIQPTAAAMNRPDTPESVPRSWKIAYVSRKTKIKPIKRKIARIESRIFSKDRHAFFRAIFAFARFFTDESSSPNIAVPYKTLVNIPICSFFL